MSPYCEAHGHFIFSFVLIELQLCRGCAIVPHVDVSGKDGSAEGTRLLPVQPQSDAVVTKYVLEKEGIALVRGACKR